MENNKNNFLIVLIFLLVLSISGLIVYVCCYKNNDNNNNETKIEEVSVDSKIVVDAMKNFANIAITKSDLYSQNVYNISNISNNDYLLTAIKNLDAKYIAYCTTNSSQNVSISQLNSSLNKYVLNKVVSMEIIKSLPTNNLNGIDRYEINNFGITIENDSIKVFGPCDFGGTPYDDYINTKIVSAEKDDNYLYVYEKQAFAKYSNMERIDPLVNYYKDFNRTILVEKDLISSNYSGTITNPGQNSTPNWNLYNTYKYTFKIVDGNYYFESFELVNE